MTLMACYGAPYDEPQCVTDADCFDYQVCNQSYGFCTDKPPECSTESDCAEDEWCSPDTQTCEPNTECGPTGDDKGCAQGSECKDGVCEPCSDGYCFGQCSEWFHQTPLCPEGTVQAVVNGIPTGECIAEDNCELRVCEVLDELTCSSSDICQPSYKGLNCTDATGAPCTSESLDCTCQDFLFDGCIPTVIPPDPDDPEPTP